MLEKIKNFLLDLIFPNHCLACKKEGKLICENCLQKLPIFNTIICPVCSRRLPGKEPQQWKCKIHGTKTKLKFVAYSTLYDYRLTKNIIGALKYNFVKELAKPMSEIMINNLKQFELANLLLVPVPLHKIKLRERNFNQAELLVKNISNETGLACADVLTKIKNTKSQTELGFNDRKGNVKNVFRCQNKEIIRNKNILLVDDVITTGATLQECAKILKQNGAKTVGAIVFAK